MTVGSAGRGFVGRDTELSVLLAAIAAARSGEPSLVLISGEAGIGKSTLVDEAAARVGALLLAGRCLRLGGDVVPLGPLADLLRHLQRRAPRAVDETEGLARFAPWLAASSSTGTASARPTAEGVFAPVLDVLDRAAADDVAVVAFEDLHWADETTWDLFELLGRNLVHERLVLVGTFRPDEAARDPGMRRRVAELGRLDRAQRVDLSGLARDDVAAQVADLCGGTADSDLVDAVFARSEGNPFFTAELVRAHDHGSRVSDVLDDLISDDLRSLDPATRAVVDAASAIGRAVSHDLLAGIVGLDDLELEARLRTAIDRQVLVLDRDVDGYHFRHALIAEVVYDRLLPSHRRRLHRAVADALLADAGAASADRIGQLAFHLDRAGDAVGAFTTLLQAADAAQGVAPAVALGQLERAFELWDEVGPASAAENRCERLWQAAELATGTTGNARAVVLAREAFRRGVPARGAAWAHERLGRYLWASGEVEASRREFDTAATLVSSAAASEAIAATMAGLAQAALMDGNAGLAEDWCRRAFDRAPSPADDPAAWVIATRVLAAARADAGDLARATVLGRAALAAASDPFARALASAYLGIVLVEAGDYDEAISVAVDGGRDARLAGLDRSFGAYLDSVAAEALLRLGRWDDTHDVFARRSAAGMEAYLPGRTRMLVTAAHLAGCRGEADRVVELLDDAASRPGDNFHAPFVAAGAAEAHLALGNWSAAATAAGDGWEATRRTRPWFAVRFAMLGVHAAVEQTLDELARRSPVDVGQVTGELDQRITEARSRVGAGAGSEGVAPVVEVQLRHAAAMLTLLGANDPDMWSDVAARWERIPDPWMAGDARLREAAAWFAAGEPANSAAALRAAHVVALELSSQTLLARVEAVSRRTRISVESAALVVVDQRSADHLGLTPREAEVLGLVASGRTNRQIGEALYVSEKTSSVHVSNILRKLGVSTRVEAAAVAQRLGLG